MPDDFYVEVPEEYLDGESISLDDPIEDSGMQEFYEECKKEFDDIMGAYYAERMQCLEDRRFYSIAGAQWEGAIGEQFENKPKFEVNKVHLGVIRIINEYLNNTITVDFVNKYGYEDDVTADSCNGLYRNDEQDSGAQEAYDNAFEEAVGGGIGAWRLCAEYEDEEDIENEYQRIRFKPIYDADSCVFFDLNCRRQDKSDATKCFVITPMSVNQFKKEYNDDPASWTKDIDLSNWDWYKGNVVYVAEVYEVRRVHVLYHLYENLDGTRRAVKADELEENLDLQQELLISGAQHIRTRTVRERQVFKYIMSGNGILEDCGRLPGKYIPVIVTYGKRWVVDGVERCMGHVRLPKDSQRLKNMQISKLGEISAYSSVEKPIFSPEQIAGHELRWAEDNVKNYPYLTANLIMAPDGSEVVSGPIGYTKSPAVPPALAALLQMTEEDIKDLLGRQEQGEELQPNISGKAIELIQNRLDMQSFIYISNFAKAVRHCGVVWLSMAQELYIEDGRKMLSKGKKEEINTVELNVPKTDPESGAIIYENDLTKATLKVYADVGPSSSSRRQSTIRNLTAVLAVTQDPESRAVINAMIMMNMEGEGVSEARSYFRTKLIKMGVIKPTEREAKDLMKAAEEAKPDANEVYLQAAADSERADAEEKRTQSVVNLADAELKRAKTVETLDKVENPPEAAT